MTYARARLWLGISGVGFMVVVSSGALWFALPQRLLGGYSAASAIGLTLACYILLSIPSDLLGGYILPGRHARSAGRFGQFAVGWLKGVVGQAIVVGICGLLLLRAAQWGGRLAGITGFALLMVLLVAAQALVARLVGSFAVTSEQVEGKSVMSYHSLDPGFVGGITGAPGSERICFPSAWRGYLPDVALRIQMIRRLGVMATGARLRGVAAAFTWNLLGFALASGMPRATLSDAPGLVTAGLWFTLWSFAGLLLLPSVNRPGVFEADRYALDYGISTEDLAATIRALDRLQDDEPARSRWVERIFHPIPSVESRLAAVESGKRQRGGWQCARTALYLSWAGFGFLSRAVHCNAGRPDLWVLFPGD